MLEINLEFKIHNTSVKIGINNYEGNLFEFLDDLLEYFSHHDDIFKNTSIEMVEPYVREKASNEITTSILPSKTIRNEGSLNKCQKIAYDSKITPDKIEMVYDFGTDDEVPPILLIIKRDTRTEAQRIAIILILYANKVINHMDKMSSHSITPILIKSDIDPTASNKAFRGEYSKFVKIEGKTYRITNQGMLKARNLIRGLVEQQGENV